MPSRSGLQDLLNVAQTTWPTPGQAQPHLLLLEGPPGIGKSHTLRQLTAQSARQNALTVQTPVMGWLAHLLRTCQTALEGERDPGFLEAARRIASDVRWAQVVQAPSLNDSVSLWNAVAHALERLARRSNGLVLLLEDAHEASSDDLGALRALYRRALLGKAPVRVVLTARPTSQDVLEGFMQDATIADAPAPERLHLTNLDEAGVKALLQEHLHSELLPDQLAAWLHARAEGHPLHTLELLRFLRDGGALRQAGNVWVFKAPSGKVVPGRLEAVLQSRLRSMQSDATAWLALSALSVLERPIGGAAWAKLTRLTSERLLDTSQRLEHHGLIQTSLAFGETMYEMVHPLYPPLLRAHLQPQELETWHERAILIAHSPSERARHARACNHAQALEWTIEALEDAQQRFAHEEVTRHAQWLLEAAPEHAQAQHWQVVFGHALLLRGELERAATTLEPLRNPDGLRLYAQVLNMLGRYADVVALVRAHADANLSLRIHELHALRGLERWDELESRYQELYENVKQGSAAWTALLQERFDTLRILNWDEDQAHRVAQELLEHHRHSGDRSGLIEALCRAGRAETRVSLQAAETHLFQALKLAEDAGSLTQIMTIRGQIGSLYFIHGYYGKARPWLVNAMNAAFAARHQHQMFNQTRLLALNEFYRGETDHALRLFEQATQLMQALQPGLYALDAQLYAAEKHAMLGNPHLGLELLDQHDFSIAGVPGYGAGTILLIAGQPERARHVLDWQPIERHQMYEHARIHNVRALSYALEARWPQAELEFAQAMEFAASSVKKPLLLELRLGLWLTRHRAYPDDDTAQHILETVAAIEGFEAGGHMLALRQLFPELDQFRNSGHTATARSEPSTQKHFLRTFGTLSIERDGKITAWKASKTRELLVHLLIANLREDGPSVPKARLIEALWPDSSGDESTENKFRVTLMRLRESLGDAVTIHSTNGVYELRHLNADVTHFLQALERLDFDAAFGWYRGSFLPDADAEDVDVIRAQLWARFRDAALRVSLEQPAPASVSLLEKLHHLEPLDVTLLERLMQALRAANDPYRLEQTLMRAKGVFERELGEVPAEVRVLERV